MGIIPLFTGLLFASVRLDLTPTKLDGNPLHLLSPSRNLTLSLVGGKAQTADSIPVASLEEGETLSLTIRCVTPSTLQIATSESATVIQSAALCSSAESLYVDEDALFGCVSNVYQGQVLLMQRLCSNVAPTETSTSRGEETTTDSEENESSSRQPVYVAEALEVNEGGSVPLQWRNVYVFTDHDGRLNVSNKDVAFSLVDGPLHGVFLLHDRPTASFTYADLLARSLIYRHDGSESTTDTIQFQVEFPPSVRSFPWLESTTYTLDVKINPVNDAPELTVERGRESVQIASKGRRVLSTSLLRVSDVDSSPEEVRLLVVSSSGVRLSVNNKTIEEFTQRQLINGEVWLVDDGSATKNELKLVAKDREKRSQVATLQITSIPVDVRLRHNTGVRLLHHESTVITNRNLSFISTPPSSPLLFTVVDLPDEGVLECGGKGGHFSLCSTFGQASVDEGLIRYRHTGESRPAADSFSFQVQSGDFVSQIHTFRILFTPMNVKVFNREVFMLNATNQRTITRESLFAWTFPKAFPVDELVYHIVEPPKFGILSRRVGEKQRRMGVSSNFTQKDIDDSLISYRLHMLQFSIVNDYLLFRVVTPSLSSEELRFEIIIVPSPTSIQLTNRTIVVDEGGQATITNDFLSLTTADERNFVFVVGAAPGHGQVYYAHNGDENRADRAYIVAESANKKGTRFPFWLSFSVIMHNDNAPKLHGSSVIYVMEKGERILRRSLLDWNDDDLDGGQLTFHFDSLSKDAALLSSISPHLPVKTFDQEELDKGHLMIRHLGLKNNSTLKYTVSDGSHGVPGEVTVIASAPFARVLHSQVEYCCSESDRQEIPIPKENLTIVTNYDVSSSSIVYLTDSIHFFLREHHGRKPVKRFTQKDVDDGLLMYVLHGEKGEELEATVGEFATLRVHLALRVRSPGASLELRRSTPLILSTRVLKLNWSAALIDDTHLSQSDAGRTPDDKLLFVVLRPPVEGAIVLDRASKDDPSPASVNAAVFSQADVLAGRVQYIHSSSSPGKDSFDFNISSPLMMRGPYTFYVEIFEHHISLSPSTPVIVTAGAASVIAPSHLTVTSSSPDYSIRIESGPRVGFIVRDTWNLGNISSIDSFTSADIASRRILVVAPRQLYNSTSDSISLVACLIDGSVCTNTASLQIRYVKRNVHAPQVVRNEVLRVLNAPSSIITDVHLMAEDADTPPDQIVYLISPPSAGIVAKTTDPSSPIHQFTQTQIDENSIAFFRRPSKNDASGSGGFSFLVSDGVHQVGPEWFSIEARSRFSAALEANSRLSTAPRSTAVITIDVMRANIGDVGDVIVFILKILTFEVDYQARPDEIFFTVVRPPKNGRIIVAGKPSYRFRQSDINRKLVVYSSVNSSLQSEWTAKDSFTFTLSLNGSTNAVEASHRKVPTNQYIKSIEHDSLQIPHIIFLRFALTGRPLGIRCHRACRGSIALNTSHINLSGLAKALGDASLVIEVARKPRYGDVETSDPHRTNVTWSEFEKGSPLVLRHSGEGGKDDDVVFFVQPEAIPTRRTNRLRVTVPIRIVPIRDALVLVTRFTPSINIVSGGVTTMTSSQFTAVHPHVPPQSILYELIQLNRGVVAVWHTATPASLISDTFVFSIEGHTRALIVRVRPMELSMENHTRIDYPQGRTYVVLNETHLGAYSSGDRQGIHYRIVTPPENGTFYWVAGEKEAKQQRPFRFTQADIDNGRILYAQLNMKSYKDRFEFSLGDDQRESLRAWSDLLVTSLGSTPRFLVASPLLYGRLLLNGIHGPGEEPSTTTPKPGAKEEDPLFFTFADVQRGRLYYASKDVVVNEVTETIDLEVRADAMQPALVTLHITVLPGDTDASGNFDDDAPLIGGGLISTTPSLPPSASIPQLSPVDGHLPLLILFCILVLTVFILLCKIRTTSRKKSTDDESPKKKKSSAREPPTIDIRRPDLLGSTVFATVSRAEEEREHTLRPTMISFDKAPPPSSHSPPDRPTPTTTTPQDTVRFRRDDRRPRPPIDSLPLPPSQVDHNGNNDQRQRLQQLQQLQQHPIAPLRLQPVPLSAKKRPQPSLDYAALTAEAPPPMSLFQQVYSDYDKSFDV
ncbi:hypothetical protein PRIPAC_86616 [Pristionchus pacificus]|uniref:Uncharacterized protein n=1 Tax=Pristionchus pacificus TaxID=54126 RepID=A0A2A6BGV7_PRIPA|nr:hypothetical protein PRIPAC_86616 [Pristionchus pacificus]|eukprot:PDM65086.1 hypothetical protein PRIPAC_53335 [Pristionchus pacificus]